MAARLPLQHSASSPAILRKPLVQKIERSPTLTTPHERSPTLKTVPFKHAKSQELTSVQATPEQGWRGLGIFKEFEQARIRQALAVPPERRNQETEEGGAACAAIVHLLSTLAFFDDVPASELVQWARAIEYRHFGGEWGDSTVVRQTDSEPVR